MMPLRFTITLTFLLHIYITIGFISNVYAQIDETCTISALNRTVQANPDGSYFLNNLTLPRGSFRVRAVCERDNRVDIGQSRFVRGVANGNTSFGPIIFDANATPVPVSLTVTSPVPLLTAQANSVRLTVTGILVSGSQVDLTRAETGTFYTSSNPNIATVSPNGLVTAVSGGRVIITAIYDGVAGSVALMVELGNDSDGDGILDDYERLNASGPDGVGLNPNDPADAALDFDSDGLTNLEEFTLGSSIFLADTDTDGLSDTEEGTLSSNPLLADSDGDGLLDSSEVEPTTDTDRDSLINILDPDSDNDGLPDGIEITLNLSPVRSDSNANQIPDGSEDSDGDGLPNLEEVLENLDPARPDTDNDSLTDGEEVLTTGTDPLLFDTDGDRFSDSEELADSSDPLDAASLPLSLFRTPVLFSVSNAAAPGLANGQATGASFTVKNDIPPALTGGRITEPGFTVENLAEQ